jgi:hypothetical protein
MKNKIKFSFAIITVIASIAYLFLVSLTLTPVLTALAIIGLLLSVLFIFILSGKGTIVVDKKNKIYIIKNKKK